MTPSRAARIVAGAGGGASEGENRTLVHATSADRSDRSGDRRITI
jgi:hypothetical protein